MADNYSLYKYRAKKDFVLFDSIISEGEVLRIQSYDSVSGRSQKVFNSDKTLMGTITSSVFWDLKKEFIEESK
jgi:hypothetical protein